MKRILTAAVLVFALVSCDRKESFSALTDRVFDMAAQQCKLMDAQLDMSNTPRTYTPQGKFIPSNLSWWCSGFFPGTLWYVYEQTGDEQIKALAEKNTIKLADVDACKSGHDVGFQYWCSYGNAYRLTGDKSYLPAIEEAAAYLCTRFNETVGCIRSWGSPSDKKSFQVIIDNMMNLELLMEGSKLFGCDSLANIANIHSKTTIANHFRPDYSSYHVLDYDQETGKPAIKRTAQGYDDETAWSRGQSWGLYGYTVMYRETKDPEYLKQAEEIAKYLIPRLPEDGIPYWDYDCPAIPYTYRDASAGAIMASALVELSTLTKNKALRKKALATAEKQIRSLASPEYMCTVPGANGCFLLRHSVGSLHGGENNRILEVDAPLTYADYYFLEAVMRFGRL